MKVFLSWSGTTSHKVAKELRDWLPFVINCLEPYVSSEDIDKGARWSTDIAKELENSTFGILCVTKDNIEAPWLLFEAGALSKMMDKAFVCPFIFDLKRSEIKGPILQFQSTIFDKDDVEKLLQTLNKACGESCLKDEMLKKSFDVWWPNLEDKLSKICKLQSNKLNSEDKKKVTELPIEILEEILELTRNNHQILRNPEKLDSKSISDKQKVREVINYLIKEIEKPIVEINKILSIYEDLYEQFKTGIVDDQKLIINTHNIIRSTKGCISDSYPAFANLKNFITSSI